MVAAYGDAFCDFWPYGSSYFVQSGFLNLHLTVHTLAFSHERRLPGHCKFTRIDSHQLIVTELSIKRNERLQNILVVRELIVSAR